MTSPTALIVTSQADPCSGPVVAVVPGVAAAVGAVVGEGALVTAGVGDGAVSSGTPQAARSRGITKIRRVRRGTPVILASPNQAVVL
jgi:hypothetical protein